MIRQWIDRLTQFASTPPTTDAEQVAAGVAEALWPQVQSQIQFMRAAEARGWLRAVVRSPVWAACGKGASRDRVNCVIESATRLLQSMSLKDQWARDCGKKAA